MPLPFLFLFATGLSAGASVVGGISANQTAKFNAWQSEFTGRLEGFNIETERKLNMAEASQRHNDRLAIYRENLSANIATFSAAGRDIGGSDRSVAAFLARQEEVAAGDTTRSDFMAQITSQKMMAESAAAVSQGKQLAAAQLAEGRGQMFSSIVSAFSTVAGGLNQYSQIKTGPLFSSPPQSVPRSESF